MYQTHFLLAPTLWEANMTGPEFSIHKLACCFGCRCLRLRTIYGWSFWSRNVSYWVVSHTYENVAWSVLSGRWKPTICERTYLVVGCSKLVRLFRCEGSRDTPIQQGLDFLAFRIRTFRLGGPPVWQRNSGLNCFWHCHAPRTIDLPTDCDREVNVSCRLGIRANPPVHIIRLLRQWRAVGRGIFGLVFAEAYSLS